MSRGKTGQNSIDSILQTGYDGVTVGGMTIPLLSTKFHIPGLRLHGVSRPRLTERLIAGLHQPGRFALLSGPAGFGKTTLLAEFLAETRQPVAWLSLDEADNDPIRFWTYLITACQSVQPEIGEAGLALLQSPQSLPDETLPTVLINDMARLEKELVLVLDDYQMIENASIHSGVSFLLEHLPEKFHPVLSTRIDPPWPLARFRARDQLVEIRAADLRFTPDETAAFLGECMGLHLSAEDVAALEARTEGWIASLQLAAISMKGRKDVAGFIKAFTGSHVFVAEYLIEEVLEHQTEEVKAFLLQTSILERLNAGLCEAVTRRSDAQEVLKGLFQANLFLLPLDDEARWFRYHQLFADLLKAHLRQSLSAQAIAALHQRAAAWYEQAGMTNEAMDHLLAAPDYAQAVRLLERIAKPMILKAYFKTVEDWLRAIPAEYWSGSPQTNMTYAWMFLMRRNFAQAAPHIERLQALFSGPEAGEIGASLQGEWLALQSVLLNSQGKLAESRDLAEQALKLLPEEEAQVRTMTYMALANAYREMLDYERSIKAAQGMIQNSRAAGDLPSEIFGLSFLGLVVLQEGRLHSACEFASQGLRLAERTGSFSPFSATLYGELAQVYYHWHQLEQARGDFERSVQLSLLGGFSDAQIYHSVFLSRLFQMEGDLQASVQEIEKALDLMQTAAPALVAEEVIAQQISILLALDRLTEAQAAIRPFGFRFDDGFSYPELPPGASLSHPLGLIYNSALRILLYRARAKRQEKALRGGIELADLVIEGSLHCRHLPIALQTLLLRAQLSLTLGEDRAALKDLTRTLELAEPEGFISTFVEEGHPIVDALTSLLNQGPPPSVQPGYVREILAAFPASQAPRKVVHAQTVSPVDEAHALIVPLTPRELEVLQLIASGDSNQAIADKLVITLSAVKKHTGNIFKKLNVDSRTQAILQARQLGLLSPDE